MPAGTVARPQSFESLDGVPGYSRKVGRTLQRAAGDVAGPADDLLDRDHDTAAAACAAGRGRSPARRVVLRDFQAVTGVTVTGSLRESGLTLRIGGDEGRARARSR